MASVNRWGYRNLAGRSLRNWALRDAELSRTTAFELREIAQGASVFDAARSLADWKPDVAGFTCYVWNVEETLRVVRALKKLAPEARIVLGGPQAAATAESLLDAFPEVDCVAAGEGEETFRLLLRALARGESALGCVPGLVFREGGAARRTEAAPLIALEDAPAVYARDADAVDPAQNLLETSRGCPFTCSYCDWGPRTMRYVPLERIASELEVLAARSSYVFLCDADILMHKERGVRILEAFYAASRGKDCVLHFETNPVFLTEEAIDVIARAPSRFHPAFGIQSVNPRASEATHRAFDLEKIDRSLASLRAKAPRARFSFSLIYGLPGDDLEGFRATLDWALRWNPGHFCAGQLMMIPGADVHRQKLQFGIEHQAHPPYQAYETAAMPRSDMRRARELAFAAGLLMAFPALLDQIYPPGAAPAPGAAVERLEAWIDCLKKRGIDAACGLPVLETDGYRMDERVRMASDALRADKLALAAILQAASGFAAKPRALAARR